MRNIVNVCLCAILMMASSCSKDYVQINDDEIKEYISKNGLEAEKTEEGLYYIITREGTGEAPLPTSTVTVHYKGYLLNGNIFDSSYDREEKSTFSLSSVIQGWQIGIPKLLEGGAGTLIIPSKLAYGENPPAGSIIEENAVLAFDIELFEIE